MRIYASNSAIPWCIPYDTAHYNDAPLLDRYTLFGGEVDLKRGTIALLLGAQSVQGVERSTISMAWPQGMTPFNQSSYSLLVAPRFGPWHGFALEARTFLCDEKPFVKSRGKLSVGTHPAHTQEFIDLSLCFDYWSERDPVSYAGKNDWNRPVYDFNAECTVQASAFRFYGKIDNILNRKFAYLPGYYSPGITFRWGFGWYLQK